MFNIEALIIGAGPAGCAAAIQLAKAGLQVTILEREPFPRDRPGETLHPGIQPLMAQLGVEEELLSSGFVRHKGNWVQWDGELKFEAFGSDENGPWLGFQAWRADFDAMLLEKARELGVEVRQPCRVQQPITEDGRVVGVKTSDGPVHARFVVDAAGSNHWLAGRLSFPIERHSPNLIARYGYEPFSELPDDQLPAIVADQSGWTWYAKIRADLYHWTRLTLIEEPVDSGASHRNRRTEKCKRMRGADVTWRAVSKPAGLGYFIVGDAAAVLDPASSHGVLKSLMTGIMAAHVARKILDQPRQEAHFLDYYGCWVSEWFQHDLKKLKDFYRRLPRPPSWLSDRPRRAENLFVPPNLDHSLWEKSSNLGSLQ